MKYRKIAQAMLLVVMCCCLAAGFVACEKAQTPPTPTPGASYTLDTDKAPQDLSAENVIYAFLKKQSELNSYKITTEGEVVADFAGYRQKIGSILFKNGAEYLNQAQSDSALVKMKHQAFSKDGKVVYRENFDGEMSVATNEEYAKYYGLIPGSISLGGYIVNPKTLRYASLEKTEGDNLTYYIRLAGDDSLTAGTAVESASTAVRIQTYSFGSLDEVPSFSDIDIRLTIKNDWTPVNYTVDCSYSCKKVFNMTVKQTLNCTYSNVNRTVEIPNVADFNAKLGSTPSQITPSGGETDPLMKVASALGSAFNGNSLNLPVTFNVELFGEPKTLSGELTLTVLRDEINAGDILNAFKLRLDVDLSKLSIVSGINTITVRYLGEGQLFLMLNNRIDNKDNVIYTQSIDISDSALKDITIENAGDIIKEILTVTDSGYTLTLPSETVKKINDMYASFIENAASKIGDDKGIIQSFLGMNLNSVTFNLVGKDKISAVALNTEIALAENTMMGEKIGVAISVGILGGAIAKPITGDLMLRLEPSALWEGDYFGIANAYLHLDLTSAADLLQMLGQFSSFGLPAFLGSTDSLDIYYMGDGILTFVINDADGLPLNVTEVDLKDMISQDETDDATAANEIADDDLNDGENEGEGEGSEEIEQPGLLPFTLKIDKGSVCLVLGEPMVQAINKAYNDLVQQLVDEAVEAAGGPDDFLGAMAGQVIKGFLAADITDIEFLLGRNEEKLMFDFAVKGNYNYQEDVLLLELTLNDKGELTKEERDDLLSDKSISEVKEYNAKAIDYSAQLQQYIDNIDITDSGYKTYVDNLKTLQDKIDAEAPAVKSLMSNNSYLADKEYKGEHYTLLLLTAKLYRDRVEEFRTQLDAAKGSFDEAKWDALNALYEKAAPAVSGVTVPAIKDDEMLKEAIGDDDIKAYLAARDVYETQRVEELNKTIEAAKEKYNDATDRENLTAALKQIVNEIKPIYEKLSAEKQALVADKYNEYYISIYTKDLEKIIEKYKEIQNKIKELITSEEKTFEKLLPLLKQLSEAQAWAYGNYYWDQSQSIDWGPGVSSTKPNQLPTEEQSKINSAFGELSTLNRSLLKGDDAKELFKEMQEQITSELTEIMDKLTPCKTVEGDEIKYDFSDVVTDKKDGEDLLEKLHAIRYLMNSVLSIADRTTVLNAVEGATDFVIDANLKGYETALKEYIDSLSE